MSKSLGSIYQKNDLTIDATDPNNFGNKALDENETWKRILSHARYYGIEAEIKEKITKYTSMLRNCKNQIEFDDIKKVAITDIIMAIGGVGGGGILIDGKLVYDESKLIKL